jgi:hypothetical protein
VDVNRRPYLRRVPATLHYLFASVKPVAIAVLEADCKPDVHAENAGQHSAGQEVGERLFDLEGFGEFFF